METPQIGGFVEGQHEIKSPAWSGKTADGLQASPLDCHKKRKMVLTKTPHKKIFIPPLF
jgi:hypothetical protein